MTRRTILITGASSGLGAEMARQFAARGRNLALCARRTERLDELRTELLAAHPGITVLTQSLDVNDHDAVFKVFRSFDEETGGLDRVIVNAGLGKGQPVGGGRFDANRATAITNFVSALAQCEAAMELFRARNQGHLVVISSVSAFRGMRRNLTTYAASKAGLTALAEGIRSDVIDTPIKVSTIFPGFIRSEMNERVKHTPLIVDTVPGVTKMVKAIEREPVRATVPAWPWAPVGFFLRHAPLRLARKIL